MSEGLPLGWQERELGEVIRQVIDFRGRTPKKLGMEWGDGTIPALSANNVQMGKVDFTKECYLASEELYQKWMTKGDTAKGDILFTMEAPLGNVALVPDDRKYILSQRVVLLKLDSKYTKNKFLYQLLRSDDFKRQLKENSTGSTAVGIQQKRLVKLVAFFPPIPEQKNIASILTSVDEVIEKTESQINKLQDLKEGMMQELLTKGIGHAEFKDSPVGRIPKEWECVQLKAVTRKFQNGYAFSASGYMERGIPIISMALIGLDGNFNKDYKKTRFWDKEARESLKRYLVKNGDLLIAMTDVTPTMELIGRCCIADIQGESLLNQRVGLISLKQDKLYKYYFAYFSNYGYWRSYSKGVSGLGAQANIGTSQILDGWVALPPLSEQQKIASSIKSVDDLIAAQTSVVESKKKIKKALMQDLLTGKVRVKVN